MAYLLRAAVLCVILLRISGATAAGLQVNPVQINFVPGANAQAIWLTNSSTEVLHAQVRPYLWTQKDGGDRLTPTDALAISPPIATIPPGARQLVRIIRTGNAKPATTSEGSYRLLIDELPVPAASISGLRYVLRYSIPVFMPLTGTPDADVITSNLTWAITTREKQPVLKVYNSGNTHAVLSEVSLESDEGGTAVLSSGLLGYVLPGATRYWPLDQFSSAHLPTLRLSAKINGRTVLHIRPMLR